jgi:hypothetical protein
VLVGVNVGVRVGVGVMVGVDVGVAVGAGVGVGVGSGPRALTTTAPTLVLAQYSRRVLALNAISLKPP